MLAALAGDASELAKLFAQGKDADPAQVAAAIAAILDAAKTLGGDKVPVLGSFLEAYSKAANAMIDAIKFFDQEKAKQNIEYWKAGVPGRFPGPFQGPKYP